MTWTVHVLNARGRLDSSRARVREAIDAVRDRTKELVGPIALDIVVEAGRRGTIPERGHVGHVSSRGLMRLRLDPDNPNFVDNLGEPFERMVAHELHHVVRRDAVVRGERLLDALVMEGLAGRFVEELYGSAPEPWECAVSGALLHDVAELAGRRAERDDHDHAEWFYGAGELPRWAGYTLGYELIGARRAPLDRISPSALAATPADAFLPTLEEMVRH